MKRTPIKKVSKKQAIEQAKRRYIHYKLWVKQEGLCKKCGRYLHYGQSELSHKEPLARGGKTTEKNCKVTCRWFIKDCHPKEHGLRNKYNEQPQWRK